MGTRVPTIYVLSKNKKNIKNFQMKFIIFTAENICSILHGRVILAKMFDSSIQRDLVIRESLVFKAIVLGYTK